MASLLTSCLTGKNFVMSLFKSKNTSEVDTKESVDSGEFSYDQKDGVNVDSDLKCTITCCASSASSVEQKDGPSKGTLISIHLLDLFACYHFKFII